MSVSKNPQHLAPLRGRALIAEDVPELRHLYRRVLERWGVVCETAEQGRAALELARRRPFDAILMDWQMPEMDGLEVTRELRRAGVTTPIVVITAAVLPAARERCLRAGADLLLPKPLDFEALHRALGGILEPAAAADPAAGGDVELAALVSEVLESLPDRVARLATAFEAKDWHAFNDESHKLAGTAGTYGLDEVYEVAEELESAGREEDSDTAELALERLAGATRGARDAPDDEER